ncbi:hypothetical protein SAMN04488137_4573 [Fictibacillus solisalsi]|uniref:SpoVT-AbrB domain-containing protein n=1 Tax=Fictibacillus solisalsi TaxID=459525 RepID=A0A1H0BN12_9BACL|nr:hypothetical protein [Fictibacillus solisalsi]SDN46962.1 hypothetical protein SAMN04488137_4573 [Fictibacillus solisalsi]
MIIETDKYYIPHKQRNIVLPIAWREEFEIEVSDKVLVCLKEMEIIISSKLVIETDNLTFTKVSKKGIVTIPKMLDLKLDSKLHQLLVDTDNQCFLISPVK